MVHKLITYNVPTLITYHEKIRRGNFEAAGKALLGNRPEFPNVFLPLLSVDLFVASSISKMPEKFNKSCKSLVFNNYWNVLHNQL